MRVKEQHKPHTVAFMACLGPNREVQIVGNARFPHLLDDTLTGLRRLRELHPDIVLLMHPEGTPEARVDSNAWPRLLDEVEADMRAREKKSSHNLM